MTDERDQLLIDVIKKLVENPELLSSIKEQTKSGASKKNMNLSPILLKENRSANKTIKKKEKNAAETSAQTPENLLQKRPEKQQKPKHIIELSVGRKKNLKR
ncbi:hypothetical protein [Methanosarcina horonobensis]|uniref:hypothetical protein n=1 Tax=Methanosarcina horonobensis TaxID=418008 RepID=UPI000AE59D4C|nr:hypothetical protein [Methanosarcina horonobensis]